MCLAHPHIHNTNMHSAYWNFRYYRCVLLPIPTNFVVIGAVVVIIIVVVVAQNLVAIYLFALCKMARTLATFNQMNTQNFKCYWHVFRCVHIYASTSCFPVLFFRSDFFFWNFFAVTIQPYNVYCVFMCKSNLLNSLIPAPLDLWYTLCKMFSQLNYLLVFFSFSAEKRHENNFIKKNSHAHCNNRWCAVWYEIEFNSPHIELSFFGCLFVVVQGKQFRIYSWEETFSLLFFFQRK